MKKYLLVVTAMLAMVGCEKKRSQAEARVPEQYSVEIDSIEDDDTQMDGRGLNDIRFENFKDEDWIDNEYIRALRRYLDGVCEGKVENEELEPYRELLKGKFVIYLSEPAMLGGLFLQIVFMDKPDIIFSSWVYSGVDEKREVVVDYQVRSVHVNKESSNMTKEELLQLLKEHPEHKLW